MKEDIPALITIDFYDFISPFTPTLRSCFAWEDIWNTSNSVSSAIQTPRISSKILRCSSYFQLSSLCLDIPIKYCCSCFFGKILLAVANCFWTSARILYFPSCHKRVGTCRCKDEYINDKCSERQGTKCCCYNSRYFIEDLLKWKLSCVWPQGLVNFLVNFKVSMQQNFTVKFYGISVKIM